MAVALGVALGLLLGALVWRYLLPPMAGAPEQDRPMAPHTSAVPSLTPDGGSGHEMALNSKPLNPDAGDGALPYMSSHPASELATPMLLKEDSRVKKEKKPAPRHDEVQGCVPVYRKVCRDALCSIALVGCTSTTQQVRPTPQPAECPPHSIETMEQTLDIPYGLVSMYSLTLGAGHHRPQHVSVREGPIQIELDEPMGKLPIDTVLTGELLFGKKRVYGRFTQALTPTGETFPVCIEFGQDGHPGVRANDSSGPDSFILRSESTLRFVNAFGVKKNDSSD
jgi:serine/threonine-protein kinase